MSKPINKINIPEWWTESFLTKMSQGSHQYLADEPGMRVIPPMHSHELQVLMLLLGFIQRKLMSDGDNRIIYLHLQEILDEYAFLNEIDRFSIVRMFFTLPAIFLKADKSQKDLELNSLLQIKKVQLDEICIDVEHTQLECIFGYSDYYSQDLRETQDIPRVLQVDPRLWMKLEGVDRKLFLIIVRELHHKANSLGNSEFIFEEDLFRACVRDQDVELKSVLQGFAGRLGRLGYLDPIDSGASESQYVKYDNLGHVHLRINDELMPVEDLQTLQTFSNLKIARYSDIAVRQMAESFYGSTIDEATYRHLKSFWERVRMQPDVFGGCIWVQNLGAVQIPMLFIEWCLRNSPLHPNPLPNQIQNSLFSDLCYLNHEKVLEHYAKFRKIMLYDSHVKTFIGNHASELVRSRADVSIFEEAPHEPLNNAIKPSPAVASVVKMSMEPQVKMVEVRAPDNKQPIDDIVKKNKLNSINIADSELWRIKKYDAIQYKTLKHQYIQSLEEIDQKVLREVESQMRKDLFEQQIHKRIVKYMVSNPGKWSSVSSRS